MAGELDAKAIESIMEKIVESGAHKEFLKSHEHVASGISALTVLQDSAAKEALVRLAYHLVERVA